MLLAPSASKAGDSNSAPAVAAIDLRPIFKNWQLDGRRQGGRGTCSVFTMTSALEYAIASQERQGIRFSVEFLNWASNDAIGEIEDGSFFSDLWKGYVKHGICTEPLFPYKDKFDPASAPSAAALDQARQYRNLGLRLHWIKPWDVKTGLTDAHLIEIKRVLARQWPVCGGFRWPKVERWQAETLVMASPDDVKDGHSVLLVGYQDDPAVPGGGSFLIRNSGGGLPDARMTYEYARAYMNDAVWIDAGAEASVPQLPAWLLPTGPAPIGRNHRVSSNEQPDWHTENLDMTWLMPGQSVEMPVFEGPGVITHMWFTSHSGWVGELDSLVLRIYWDGQSEPGVEAPLGDFFAVGQGKPAVVESIPVQVSPTGALSSYWRMPFHRSARVVISNDNPDRSTGLYWQVDWTQLDGLPAETPHFNAQFRHEYPAVAGRDYTIADLTGQGFFVGTVMSVTLAQDGWFGEGDDFFYIDGETVPSLQGTGSEDYFNDAWGFRPRTSHWFGQPRWQGDNSGDSGVCYRWHLADPVFFSKSLRLDIEHKGNCVEDTDGFYVERPDFLSSVAFWYQTGEAKRMEKLPPYPNRRVPWQTHHFVSAFEKASVKGTGAKPVVQTTGFFGARPTINWDNKKTDATLTFPFEITKSGRHAVRLTAGAQPGAGRFAVLLDGRKALEQDFQAAEETELDLSLGSPVLTNGTHTLTFKALGPQPSPLVVEQVRTLALPEEVKRTVRTHHEAHFVRLGIGRAVYAYRMAHGRLPDSFETLVRSGIMPEKYTRDENGAPLKAWVEDGYFNVASQTGWKHRWQGLDARR
jgi:hypothetical protein